MNDIEHLINQRLNEERISPNNVYAETINLAKSIKSAAGLRRVLLRYRKNKNKYPNLHVMKVHQDLCLEAIDSGEIDVNLGVIKETFAPNAYGFLNLYVFRSIMYEVWFGQYANSPAFDEWREVTEHTAIPLEVTLSKQDEKLYNKIASTLDDKMNNLPLVDWLYYDSSNDLYYNTFKNSSTLEELRILL